MKIAAKLAMEELRQKTSKRQKIEQNERLKMFEQVLQMIARILLANYGAAAVTEALGGIDNKAVPL